MKNVQNVQDAIAKIEVLFSNNENKPFVLTHEQTNYLFGMTINDKNYYKIHKYFSKWCGISISYMWKAEMFGFMRVKDVLNWNKIDLPSRTCTP